MPTIQERIKERRTALNLTLLEIAEQLNVKEATVQRYESGEIKNIKHETIVALAKILKCSPQYLMGWSNNVNDTVTPVNSDNIYMRPVYNSAAAGFNVLAQDTIVDYIPTFISVPSEQELYIWVNVVGESMSPKIDEGDTLLIKRQESVDSGSIAVVLIDDEEASVKKVVYGDDWIELQSFNPYYPPRRFEGAEVQRIRVMGLVKRVLKDIN